MYANHEFKFTYGNHLAAKVVNWMEKRCVPDPTFPASRISSIYYDSRDWIILREKLNSEYLKLKIRVRWYADAHSSQLFPSNFIEAKYKIGSARKKVRMPSGRESDWLATAPMYLPDFMQLPPLLRSLGVVLRENLFPAFQVSYTRRRFIDPLTGARLCVDQDIHVPRTNPLMISTTRPVCMPVGVVEYKQQGYDDFPDWLSQINAFQGRRAAFSKYLASFQHITNFQH
ncbi:VTC domain-containing protein [Desulfobulbus alkaliphilus]|uniref:VTC domain-containing protein n=1 Tax=Desulfobulbus alkaliphilus TaxID=869814 RepID=UPI0019625CB3|nr:VTC domain-containing protein [Desulfobulbus alkaliphilus]